MTTIETLRTDVLELLWKEYCVTVAYQKQRNDITVTMRFAEYVTLWSRHRIKSLEDRIDKGPKSIDFYMSNQLFRPVCGWVRREDRVRGGVMTVDMARIMSANESRKMFQFQAGDRHTLEARARIGAAKSGKAQTPEQIAKRTAARVATMARKRAEKASIGGGE